MRPAVKSEMMMQPGLNIKLSWTQENGLYCSCKFGSTGAFVSFMQLKWFKKEVHSQLNVANALSYRKLHCEGICVQYMFINNMEPR